MKMKMKMKMMMKMMMKNVNENDDENEGMYDGGEGRGEEGPLRCDPGSELLLGGSAIIYYRARITNGMENKDTKKSCIS